MAKHHRPKSNSNPNSQPASAASSTQQLTASQKSNPTSGSKLESVQPTYELATAVSVPKAVAEHTDQPAETDMLPQSAPELATQTGTTAIPTERASATDQTKTDAAQPVTAAPDADSDQSTTVQGNPDQIVEPTLGSKRSVSEVGSTTDSVAAPTLSSQTVKGRQKRGKARKLIIGGVILLGIVASVQWYVKAHRNPDVVRQAQISQLISEVGQRAVLPSGEEPTVRTVVNKDKVSQAFLANAQDGDKVLLYFQAGKAIVYRPSSQQIVNIGPLAEPASRIFLRNGTTSASLPSSIRTKLDQDTKYQIVSQDVAVRRSYTKTLVIDIAGNRPDIAAKIASQIGGRAAPLPSDESRPDADFLIIVGSDAP